MEVQPFKSPWKEDATIVETESLYGPQMHLFQLEMISVPRGNLGLDMSASSILLTN